MAKCLSMLTEPQNRPLHIFSYGLAGDLVIAFMQAMVMIHKKESVVRHWLTCLP